MPRYAARRSRRGQQFSLLNPPSKCPDGRSACPIGHLNGYECVDLREELK